MTRRLMPIKFVLVGLCLTVSPLTAELEFPAKPTARVNDYAHLFSRQETAYLERKLTAWEQATSNQLVIATFEDLQGEELNDISIRIAEAWQIGQAGRDNGVLITVFLRNRKLRLEVGYGLEGILPDAVVNDIRLNLINPHFKEGDYFEGLNLAADAIIAAVSGEYEALRQSKRVPKQRGRGGGAGLIFMIIFFFLLLGRGRRVGGLFPALFFLSLGSGIGRHSGGFGGSFRGGGFGGFGGGGGGFGGGGAGGSW